MVQIKAARPRAIQERIFCQGSVGINQGFRRKAARVAEEVRLLQDEEKGGALSSGIDCVHLLNLSIHLIIVSFVDTNSVSPQVFDIFRVSKLLKDLVEARHDPEIVRVTMKG